MSEMISVSEAAQRLGVSRYRVYARLRDGSIQGRRSGRSWIVDSSTLSSARRSRPLSPPMALALAQILDRVQLEGLYASEEARLAEKCALIESSPVEEVLELIRSWMASRASAVRVEVASADLADLRQDSRLFLSGLSDPRVDIAAADVVEGYLASGDLRSLTDDFFIDLDADYRRPNVFLHVLEARPAQIPRLLSAADLIDHGGAREKQAALRLLGRA